MVDGVVDQSRLPVVTKDDIDMIRRDHDYMARQGIEGLPDTVQRMFGQIGALLSHADTTAAEVEARVWDAAIDIAKDWQHMNVVAFDKKYGLDRDVEIYEMLESAKAKAIAATQQEEK